MMNLIEQNPTLAAKWGMQMKMFNRMNWIMENMDAKVQPVYANDVALAIINCLKMEETIGQSYDLGGPHTIWFTTTLLFTGNSGVMFELLWFQN